MMVRKFMGYALNFQSELLVDVRVFDQLLVSNYNMEYESYNKNQNMFYRVGIFNCTNG